MTSGTWILFVITGNVKLNKQLKWDIFSVRMPESTYIFTQNVNKMADNFHKALDFGVGTIQTKFLKLWNAVDRDWELK